MLLPLEVLLLLTVVGRWVIECKVEPDGQGGGSISMGMDFNDEYDHSTHMPTELRCDACRVIAYQLTKKFNEAHEKRPSIKKFEESEIIDITDSICDQDWKEYGIKFMDNVKRMSGEGLETNELPGVMQTGGKIPERLKEMCSLYMGEVGEMAIYERYLASKPLERFLCRGPGIRGYCTESDGAKKQKNKNPQPVEEMEKERQLKKKKRAEEAIHDSENKNVKRKKSTSDGPSKTSAKKTKDSNDKTKQRRGLGTRGDEQRPGFDGNMADRGEFVKPEEYGGQYGGGNGEGGEKKDGDTGVYDEHSQWRQKNSERIEKLKEMAQKNIEAGLPAFARPDVVMDDDDESDSRLGKQGETPEGEGKTSQRDLPPAPKNRREREKIMNEWIDKQRQNLKEEL